MVKRITCPRNIVNIIHHINRLRKKSHVIILISRKNVSQKSNPFLIKTLNAVEIIGMFLNLIKGIYEKRTISTIFHGKRLNAFPGDQNQSKDVSTHHFYCILY